MAVLHAICHTETRPLREVNANVPEPIEIIVRRLHEKQPHDRFATASCLRELLADYLAHLQEPATNRLPAALGPRRKSNWVTKTVVVAGIVLGSIHMPAYLVDFASDERAPVAPISPQLASKLDDDAGYGTSPFDAEVERMVTAIEQVEAQWRSDVMTSTDAQDDGWHRSFEKLRPVSRLNPCWRCWARKTT